MATATPASAAFHFRVSHGSASVDCIVTDDAVEALGAGKNELSAKHRKFLEGIAAERVEWCHTRPSEIVIDAWDIKTHSQD